MDSINAVRTEINIGGAQGTGRAFHIIDEGAATRVCSFNYFKPQRALTAVLSAVFNPENNSLHFESSHRNRRVERAHHTNVFGS
jgi:hypothetical protein